jgi:transposase-like protein
MNSIERRIEPRRQHLKAWDDEMRKVFRSVEAAVIQEIVAPVRCPHCREAAEVLGDFRSALEWYRCAKCESLWAARSARAV